MRKRGNLNLVGGQPHQGSEYKRLGRQENFATLSTGCCCGGPGGHPGCFRSALTVCARIATWARCSPACPRKCAMSNPIDTLRARRALAGIALHVTTNDRGQTVFIATSRWALTRTFETIAEVEEWLDRVAGKVQQKVVIP